MPFYFQNIAAVFDSWMSDKSSKLHFHILLRHCSFCHTTKKKTAFLLSSPPPLQKMFQNSIWIRNPRESEGCDGSIDCGTCFQKQRGNHHHVHLCTAVKPAMVHSCLFKSVTHFHNTSYLADFELGFTIALFHVKLNFCLCLLPCQVGSRGAFQIQVQPAGQFQRSAGQVVAEKTHWCLLPSRGPGRTQRLLSVQELATSTHTT